MLLQRAGHLWDALVYRRYRPIRHRNGGHLIIFAHQQSRLKFPQKRW